MAWALGHIIAFLKEFALLTLFSLIFELAFTGIRRSFSRGRNRNLPFAFLLYSLFGSFFGWMTLIIYPHTPIWSSSMHIIQFLISPVAIGLCVGMWAARRKSSEKFVIRPDRFILIWGFSQLFALVRFFLTE